MRQIMSGRSDSLMLRSYKAAIGKETLKDMQRTEHHRLLKKPKRLRSAFTTEQTNYLETAYKKFPYIDKEGRQHLASVLKIGERPIKIWFQNRRMKEKKENQNHKEFDDEIRRNGLKFGQNQLNNVSVPSTNDNSYSLPILSLSADSTVHINNVEVNNEDFIKNKPSAEPEKTTSKANFYKEVKNLDNELHFQKQSIVDSTVLYTTDAKKKPPSDKYDNTKSAEISINLCKKYKEERASSDSAVTGNIGHDEQKAKTKPHQAPKKESFPKALLPNKKIEVSNLPPPPKPPSHVNIDKSVYYPVMPGVYPSPFVTSDGVLWKPVMMQVMATNGPSMTIGNQAPPIREGIKNCTCNCHSSSRHVPVSFPPSFQNPYTQYVISVPFPHTSSNF